MNVDRSRSPRTPSHRHNAHLLLCSLINMKVPSRIVYLVWVLLVPGKIPCMPWLEFLETFAGHRAITRAFLESKRAAIGFERDHDPIMMDFCGHAGFCHCLHLAAQTVWGGGSWHAPVCSTWIALNVGTSGRHPGRPLGNQHYDAASTLAA